MTASIIDGKAVALRLTEEIKVTVAARVAAGMAPPGLAVVLVGDNAASHVYVRNKRRTTEAVGMRSFAHDLPVDAEEEDLWPHRRVERRSRGERNPRAVAAAEAHRRGARHRAIDPRKDVDGFHPYNIGRLVLKRPALRPCTPYGCMTLLKETGEDR
jgi:methylenetetrahydrofolate dehydrogenase (NADP+)/methenyltetrahydrofolate cyclohydrolase